MQSVPPEAAAGASPSPRASERPEPAPAGRALALPRRFGRYQLFDRIGRGGMAEIYLARAQTGIGEARLVVVKQIHEALSRDDAFARMFVDEAKLCAGLRHANVVQVLDLGREEDLLYMAMEYVEGFDLNQLLVRCSRAKVPLPPEFAIFVVREVLAALDFAHRATDAQRAPLGIVHRDVSPSNVLISLEGEVKLCDFGIARAAGRAAAGADGGRGGRVVGKSAYMSPEHARGEELDARADVFAAGILLWELCAGRRLYRGSEAEMLEQAKQADVPPLPDRGLPSPARLAVILEHALAPAREERYASAAEMLSALDEYAAEARLFASQLRFGAFLTDHFGTGVVAERRARERAARALEKGPPALLEPIGRAPPPGAPLASEGAAEVNAAEVRAAALGTGAPPAISDVTTGKLRLRTDDTDPEHAKIAASAPAAARTDPGRGAALAIAGLAVLAVLVTIAALLVLAR